MRIRPAGDRCLTVTVGRRIHPRIHRRVQRLVALLESSVVSGIIELVPSYCAIAIHYDPLRVTPTEIRRWIRGVRTRGSHSAGNASANARLIEIPTCYGGEHGPDLEAVARHARVTPEAVIDLHQKTDYLVYMLGFTPGFPYLGGLDPRIAAPRRAEPRTHIPAGAVGIAGRQTGIYPVASPGGWQLIGRTPVCLFDPNRPGRPFLLAPGDRVRFVPISEAEYGRLAGSDADAALDRARPQESASPDDTRRTAHAEGAAGSDRASGTSVRIISAGVFSTIQDAGRHGYQRFGMPVAGAMDQFALHAGNLLVGNSAGSAAIEFTFAGLEVEFVRDAVIAVCGARCTLEMIDRSGRSRPIRDWCAVEVAAGSRVVVRATTSGCRGYLCIAGGWQIPSVLGSASTYLRAGVGGIAGRSLAAGDVLSVATSAGPARLTAVPESIIAEVYPREAPIRVVPGPHVGRFPRAEVERFLAASWKVGVNSDRMGYRLDGPAVGRARAREAELISESVEEGTVQIPPNGQPVVMLADRQTTGGYPKIAHVISGDLPRLAQSAPGARIRFTPVGITEAHALLQRSAEHLAFVARLAGERDTDFLEIHAGNTRYRIAVRAMQSTG